MTAMIPVTDQCTHDDRAIRYVITATGSKQYREQCLACGDYSSFLKHSDPRIAEAGNIYPVDTALREQSRKERWEEARQHYRTQQAKDNQEWWDQYNAYLLSPEWRLRRQRVLERDAYTCQSCLAARATQVHHLTYKHVFHEPLFELTSVCEQCHDHITALDRGEPWKN